MMYLSRRVIEDGMLEIHEQEVGHDVFGRPPQYDTTADNIVRVHASTLRKRLEQYFAEEGRDEPILIELPKGNYAPVFRNREVMPPLAEELPAAVLPLPSAPPEAAAGRPVDWKLPLAAGLALLFACSTAFLWLRLRTLDTPRPAALPPAVREFWGSVFVPRQAADIVLDDAALGLYQELDGRPVGLSEYFDRSYLRRLGQPGQGSPLAKEVASAMMLKRHTSYANVSLLGPLNKVALALNSDWTPHFARDYAFREVKSNRAVLLGNSRSNPWIEPFENRLGIRWNYDATSNSYYPIDSWNANGKTSDFRLGGEHPDGYCSIALLPNLSGTGDVIILSATGGSATASAAAFLTDGARMAELRAKLRGGSGERFPYFEALLRIPSRSRLPKDAEIVIARAAR